MYLVESKVGAIACILVALVLLGTWPAILALLERRGRLPQHTYLDYSFTNFLTAFIIALTLGQIGEAKPHMPNFLFQLSQNNWSSVLITMAGGVFLSLGNLSKQYAWAFVGLSVTEVFTSSFAVILGVGCFLIAVCLGAAAVHSSNTADNTAKLEPCQIFAKMMQHSIKSENGCTRDDKARAGSAVFLIELENLRAIKVFGKSIWFGLIITFFAVVCYSLFSPALNLATNYQLHMMKPLVPHQLYLKDWNGRNLAFFAGFFCWLGNGLQFIGGQAAGYAAADCVQALPLMSTFWGMVFFGEYRRSSPRTNVLLGSMLFMFIAAVAVLIASSGHHKA